MRQEDLPRRRLREVGRRGRPEELPRARVQQERAADVAAVRHRGLQRGMVPHQVLRQRRCRLGHNFGRKEKLLKLHFHESRIFTINI